MRPPPVLHADKDAEAFFKTIRGDITDADVERLTDLLIKYRIATLREAVSHCEGQRLRWDDAKNDEYRRGQYRGANDCAIVVSRLASALEGRWPPSRNYTGDPQYPGCDECKGSLHTMGGPSPPNPCPCTFGRDFECK